MKLLISIALICLSILGTVGQRWLFNASGEPWNSLNIPSLKGQITDVGVHCNGNGYPCAPFSFGNSGHWNSNVSISFKPEVYRIRYDAIISYSKNLPAANYQMRVQDSNDCQQQNN
ncbi:hypothetical protein GCM10009117_14700 [Gangjinia marincola]|uniref:Uncharacterized protein n=1 Tax=Gangjinia marincola TaxID=578463 RepID=A0ABN1MGM1_9FLAO